jgi:NDP-sugar pyrophosphorylase family protein
MTAAIVLCGGLGTRLGELTRETPKPMLPVAGRPFLAHVLDDLRTPSINAVVLAVGFQWRVIAEYVGEEWHGLPVRFSVEGTAMGTGGAVHLAMQRFDLDQALIVNGDTLFRINFEAFLAEPLPADCTTRLALRRVDDCGRYGSVTVDDRSRILAFGEKGRTGPGLINGGIYLQKMFALERFGSKPFSFETDYLAGEAHTGRLQGVPYDAYFVDIGVPDDLERAKRELAV